MNKQVATVKLDDGVVLKLHFTEGIGDVHVLKNLWGHTTTQAKVKEADGYEQTRARHYMAMMNSHVVIGISLPVCKRGKGDKYPQIVLGR